MRLRNRSADIFGPITGIEARTYSAREREREREREGERGREREREANGLWAQVVRTVGCHLFNAQPLHGTIIYPHLMYM